MRVVIFVQRPPVKSRWDQRGEQIPEIPFFFLQSPRKKSYQTIGAKVIRGHKAGKESIHANLIPIGKHITFSDWRRPDGKEVDITLEPDKTKDLVKNGWLFLKN